MAVLGGARATVDRARRRAARSGAVGAARSRERAVLLAGVVGRLSDLEQR